MIEARHASSVAARLGLAFAVAEAGEADTVRLLPGEASLCDGMPPARLAEWLGGRLAARRALAMLGRPDEAVLADRGRPVFPAGIRGSISHSAGVAVALAGPAAFALGVGVDVERRRLALRAVDRVASDAERAWVFAAPAEVSRRERLTFLCSVKESAFKALAAAGAAPAVWSMIDVVPTGRATFAATWDGRVLEAIRMALGPFILTWALMPPRVDGGPVRQLRRSAPPTAR